MPQSQLFAAVQHAAAHDANFGVTGWLQSIGSWLLSQADPRLLIDTPEERAALEDHAMKAFEAIVRPAIVTRFGPILGPILANNIAVPAKLALDALLVSIASTLPAKA